MKVEFEQKDGVLEVYNNFIDKEQVIIKTEGKELTPQRILNEADGITQDIPKISLYSYITYDEAIVLARTLEVIVKNGRKK